MVKVVLFPDNLVAVRVSLGVRVDNVFLVPHSVQRLSKRVRLHPCRSHLILLGWISRLVRLSRQLAVVRVLLHCHPAPMTAQDCCEFRLGGEFVPLSVVGQRLLTVSLLHALTEQFLVRIVYVYVIRH